MADGFFALGDILGGGQAVRNEAAYLDGLDLGSQINLRRGQTENAIAQARTRRNQAIAQEGIRDSFAELGLDPALGDIGVAGLGNFDQLTKGDLNIQQGGFRDTIADATLPFEQRQAAAQAVEGKVVNPLQFGPGGELFADVFNPGAGPALTPTGTAQIGADDALATQRIARAKLDDEQRLHPERFKTSTGGAALQTTLAEAVLPGGEGVSIIPGDIVAEEGFGLESTLKSGVNAITDWVGAGNAFPENAAAVNILSELSTRTQVAMRADVPGGRPPLMVQELLARYAEDPSQLFRGDEQARLNLGTTYNSLVRSQMRIRDQLNSPTKKTPTRQGELEKAYLDISDTVADYRAIIDSLDRKYGPLEAGAMQPAADADGWTPTSSGARYRLKKPGN